MVSDTLVLGSCETGIGIAVGMDLRISPSSSTYTVPFSGTGRSLLSTEVLTRRGEEIVSIQISSSPSLSFSRGDTGSEGGGSFNGKEYGW